MLEPEFERLTQKPFTDLEFVAIHYVYCYHPAIKSKEDIAMVWNLGGNCLINDMLPTAKRFEAAERRLRTARMEYEAAKKQLIDLIEESGMGTAKDCASRTVMDVVAHGQAFAVIAGNKKCLLRMICRSDVPLMISTSGGLYCADCAGFLQ